MTKELITWLKRQEKKGYSLKQMYGFLKKQGYKQMDIFKALFYFYFEKLKLFFNKIILNKQHLILSSIILATILIFVFGMIFYIAYTSETKNICNEKGKDCNPSVNTNNDNSGSDEGFSNFNESTLSIKEIKIIKNKNFINLQLLELYT